MAGAPALVPFPAHLALQDGQFVVDNTTPLVVERADSDAARIGAYFVDLIQRSRGLTLAIKPGAAHAIVLRRLADPNATGKEGYRLEVTADGITISASQTAGLFYGAVTLWQLLTQTGGLDVPYRRSGSRTRRASPGAG